MPSFSDQLFIVCANFPAAFAEKLANAAAPDASAPSSAPGLLAFAALIDVAAACATFLTLFATFAIRAKLARKIKIPGFGHRVYRTEDPRATHLRRMSKDLGERAGSTRWYDMSKRIEALVTGEKKLFPNVDFYSASTYYTLGIPIDLFTPIFAVSRVSGWTAHCLEQYKNNRLIRPRTDYIGPTYPQTFLPLDSR